MYKNEALEMNGKEMDKVVLFLSSIAKKKCSIIHVRIDGKEKCYETDKQVDYWLDMEHKYIRITGIVVKSENISSTEKLFVLNTTLIVSEGNDIIVNTDEFLKYESMISSLSEEKKEYIYNLIDQMKKKNICTDEEIMPIVYFSSDNELELLYKIKKSTIPLEVRREIEKCFYESKRGSSTERANAKKVVQYLVNFNWLCNDAPIDVDLVMKRLNESHIGMEHPKEIVRKELLAFNRSKDKIPQIILLTGRTGCGKTSFAEALFKAMEKPYSYFNVSGLDDVITILGAARLYDNGRPGELGLKYLEHSPDAAFIIDELDKAAPNCINALFSFFDRRFRDDFLEIALDLSRLWIVCLANDIKKVHPAFLRRMKVVNVDEYTNKEKMQIINKIFIPRICEKFGIEQNGFIFSDEVNEKIITEIAIEEPMSTIEHIVEEIFVNSIEKAEKFPQINIHNFFDYYYCDVEKDRVFNTYARDYAALKRKIQVCNKKFPENIRKKNAELLEMATYGTDDNKEYAISALRVTANILKEDEKTADIVGLKKELDESHYGLEKVKTSIAKVVIANVMTKTHNIKAILLDGCPGVGKTSICKCVAKALGKKFIKISMNGVSSSETIKGFPRTYKDSQPGIIALKLAEPGVCSYSAVVLLDEVDKMIVNSRDDPYTTLHDLLDNNGGFYDQYLETTIPTENILWILTSNEKGKVPPTILDRVRVIDVEGYSIKEKKIIAREYVLPDIAKRYQLDKINMSDEVLECLIHDYCISYGVRDVEKAIECLIETIAINKNISIGKRVTIEKKDLQNALGAKHFGYNDFPEKTKDMYGQARALAVAGNYGATFAIQVVENPFGKDDLEMTGLAKGSFAESIRVAKTLVCNTLNMAMPKVHIHALDPGIEKDGPSAGVTLFAAMMSFMIKKTIPNYAFSGTIDLLGNIGVVGGMKLKLAAAEKVGVESVFIPTRNYEILWENGDLDSFEKITIIPVKHIDELLKYLFGELYN